MERTLTNNNDNDCEITTTMSMFDDVTDNLRKHTNPTVHTRLICTWPSLFPFSRHNSISVCCLSLLTTPLSPFLWTPHMRRGMLKGQVIHTPSLSTSYVFTWRKRTDHAHGSLSYGSSSWLLRSTSYSPRHILYKQFTYLYR